MIFLEISDKFIEDNKRQKIVKNPAAVIFQVLSWTNGEPYLTALILTMILENSFKISEGEEEKRVADFVKFHIITEWENKNAFSHFDVIRHKLLQHPQKEQLLLNLSKILKSEHLPTEHNAEVRALLASSLVVYKGGKLKVHNPIYKAVFNLAWIQEELGKTQHQFLRQKSHRPANVWPLSASYSLPYATLRSFSPTIISFLSLFAIFLAWQQWPGKSFLSNNSEWFTLRTRSTTTNRSTFDPMQQNPMQQNISMGEKALIQVEETTQRNLAFRAAKKHGIRAISDNDYEDAIVHFEQALDHYHNAPETLIYLNNARSEVKSPEKNYTIAAAVPITVDLSAAQAMLRGVAQAQDSINQQGGINGVPLKVAIVDDGTNADIAPQIASMLGSKSEILGVVGHYYGSVTLNAADTYQNEGLSIVSLSTSVDLAELDNDHIFRISPNDAVVGKALATHMLDVWKTARVAVFYNAKNTDSNSLSREFINSVLSNGGEVVSEFDWSEDDFSPQQAFAKAIEYNAQVLMLAPSEFKELENNGFLISQLNFNNKNPLKLMGGDVVYSDKVLKQDFEDMVVGTFWHIGAADPTSEFIIRSKQLWRAEVNWVTAMAYDATQAWIEALKRSHPEPTRSHLQQILSSSVTRFSAPGVSHDIHFNAIGDRLIPIQLVRVDRDNDSTAEGYRFDPVVKDD